ncbi:hypothetical protein N9218_00115 [bacterium]|nr:hypothetical protein [bacterium]
MKRTELPRAGDAQSWDGHTDIAASHREFGLKDGSGNRSTLGRPVKRLGLSTPSPRFCVQLISTGQAGHGSEHSHLVLALYRLGRG